MIRRAIFIVGIALWLASGVAGEAMFNATERVRFARLFQDPRDSNVWSLTWVIHAAGGPLAFLGSALFVFAVSEPGYQGFSFTSAPFPCKEVGVFERRNWCGSNA